MSSKESAFSRSVFSGLIWSYLSAGLYAVLQLLTVVVLSRLLSPREFGIVGLALIFVSFAERFGHAGIGQALVQKKDCSQPDLDAGLTLSCIAGVVLTAIFLLITPLLATTFSEPDLVPVLHVLATVFLVDAIIVVPDAVLQRNLAFNKLAIIENSSYFIGIGVVGIGLALMGWGVWSLVFGQVALRIAKALLFFVLIPSHSNLSLDLARFRDLLQTGIGFGFGRVFGFLALYADNMIIGKVLGTTSLGLYSRAYQLMTLPATLVGQIADRVLFPAFSRKQSEPEALRKGLFVLVEILTLSSLPVSVIFCLLSDEIIAVLLGNGWEEAASVLEILSYGIFFRTAYKAGDTVSRSVGRVYLHAWVHALYAAAVALGAYLGSDFGVRGVAYGVLGAVTLNYFAMSHLAIRSVKGSWGWFLRAHLSGVWISAAFAVVGVLGLPTLRSYNFPPIVTLACACVAWAVTGIVTWCVMPSSARRVVVELWETVGKARRNAKGV